MPPRPVPVLAGLVLACACWPAAALAQATVSALQPDAKAAALVRLGSVKPEPLPFGQALDPGDELLSTRNDTLLVLRCADASTVTFQGSFRVAILPAAGGAPCAVDLLAGSALVNAVSPDTTVQAGEVTMASKGTLYEVRVGLAGGRLARDVLVYDGQVSVAASAESAGGGGERGGARKPRTVSSGERLVMAGARGDLARVDRRDMDRAALAYARTDLARAADMRPRIARKPSRISCRATPACSRRRTSPPRTSSWRPGRWTTGSRRRPRCTSSHRRSASRRRTSSARSWR